MEIDSSKPIYNQEPGDVILEDFVLLSFFDLTDKFDPIKRFNTISEMSRLIESVVFFERLFVFDYELDNENTEAYYATENPLILADIINKLSNEKILNYVQAIPFEKYPQPSVLLKLVKKSKIIPTIKLNCFNDFRFPYYLYQQEIARKSNCPFISSNNDYVEYFINGSQKYKLSLANKLVQSINQNVNKQFTDILNSHHNIEIIIPPFLPIVLNSVIKGASFGEAILDLRNKFSGIRKLFVEYNQQFYDSTKPLKDQIKIANRIFSDIYKIAQKFSVVEKTKYKIWTDSFDFILDSTSNIKDFNVLNNANLISRLFKLSKEMLNELLFRYRYNSMYKLQKDFYNIKEYSTILIKAIEPTIKESKKIFDRGYICISPGNPFRAVPGYEKD